MTAEVLVGQCATVRSLPNSLNRGLGKLGGPCIRNPIGNSGVRHGLLAPGRARWRSAGRLARPIGATQGNWVYTSALPGREGQGDLPALGRAGGDRETEEVSPRRLEEWKCQCSAHDDNGVTRGGRDSTAAAVDVLHQDRPQRWPRRGSYSTGERRRIGGVESSYVGRPSMVVRLGRSGEMLVAITVRLATIGP